MVNNSEMNYQQLIRYLLSAPLPQNITAQSSVSDIETLSLTQEIPIAEIHS